MMRHPGAWLFCCWSVVSAWYPLFVLAAEPTRPPVVRDVLWVWGNPEMGTEGDHSIAQFRDARPVERARLLGVPNVFMAGHGLPHDRELADRWTAEVAQAPRLVWEIIEDGDTEHRGKFVFQQRIADIEPLVKKYSQVEAVLLDDMTSVAASKGFRAEHLRNIRQLIAARQLPLKLWGVLYTMNFSAPTTDPLVNELDLINLWHWHAKDTANMPRHVAECEQRYPGKPIILGLYMYDYGGGRRMPLDLHKQQCETALGLVHEKRVQGIVFLSINDDPELIGWTADWIERVADQRIGTAKSEP